MMVALLSFLSGRVWIYVVVAGALALLIGWHVFHEAEVRRQAISTAIAVEGAKWRAALDKANADAEARLSALQMRADAAGRAADETSALLAKALKETETANAKLPNTASCVLDRARVRLLDRLR